MSNVETWIMGVCPYYSHKIIVMGPNQGN